MLFKNVFTLFVEQLLKKGTLFISTLVLAYFLSPEEFGLLSVSMFIVGFANSFVESGLKDAIIRTQKVSDTLLSTAFWINNTFSLIAFALILLATPIVSLLYNESLFMKILPTVAVSTLLFAQQVIPLAIIHKRLDFHCVLRATFPAALISSILGVTLAATGFGIWSLIVQIVLNTALTSFLLFSASGFAPKFVFNRNEARILLSFGAPLFGANVISTIGKNIVFLIPGKILGLAVSGYIYFADKIMEAFMSQIIYSVQQASYPMLAKYLDDKTLLKQEYRKILIATSTAVTFVLGLFFSVSGTVPEIFFSAQWHGIGKYIAFLSASYFLYPVHAMNMNILKLFGKTKTYFYLDIYKLILGVSVITVSSHLSVDGLLSGLILLSVVNLLPNIYFTRKLLEYGYLEQLSDYLSASFAPLLGASLAYSIAQLSLSSSIQTFWLSACVYFVISLALMYFTSNRLLAEIKKKLFERGGVR